MGNKAGKMAHLKPQTLEELRNHIDVDFTTNEIQEWYDDFKSRLKPGQKELTKKHFRQVYESLFQGDASEFAEQVFRTFDENKNGTVDFKEFILGLCMSGSTVDETKLKWAFSMYDINGDGFIEKEEMHHIIKAIYKMTNCTAPSAEELTEDLFKRMDNNQDGKISLEEFVKGASQDETVVGMLQVPPDPIES